ncbi:MAG: arginine--tRNA ligase [Spirochaetes bacterium]|nr:arginine--tRNA ligase [Spirochaetota bacterium]
MDVKRFLAQKLLETVGEDAGDPYGLIERPPKEEFGDYAIPCFGFAKKFKKDPKLIASDLASQITPGGLLAKAESLGPYLNLYIDRKVFTKEAILALRRTGFEEIRADGEGKTVVIDYSSPNIAKPFGIGHLRSTVIGGSLKRIFSFCGFKTVGINHIGDWGTQFGKLISAYRRWGDERALEHDPIRYLYDLYVRFHAEAEKTPQFEQEGREWFNRLEKGDEEARELWRRFRSLSIEEFKRIYERLDVSFDYYTGESFYEDLLDETVKAVKASGITQMSEGALVVPLPDMPPALIRKQDGSTLYLTRDIAAVLYRKKEYDFDVALYVVGSPQALHFKQLFTVLARMGKGWAERCHHVPFGQIRFADEAMSTRKGNIVFLEEVLDRAASLARGIIEEKNPGVRNKVETAEAIGVGAVIFNDLKNSRIKDIAFDWDEMLNFNGETGVYLQYTHARIKSLLLKLEKRYKIPGIEAVSDISFGEEGYEVARLLNEFEAQVRRARSEFEPSVIARYLLEVAKAFNGFYNAHRVITGDRDESLSRGLVADCCRKVLSQGLELLCIRAIEEM